ncbi:hypothetical protein [Desertivirga arenae]|uniref:hypothetical protein n=1 Tax=Desertivirga arenae TaxID=2810309 RepID=UPI001A95C659|nr:hypothetical protein [Pedobacter sp. SYSU D00823]
MNPHIFIRILITSLCIFFSQFAFSQDKPFEQIIGWRGGHGPIRIKSISDSTKSSSCVLLKNDERLKVFLFDSKMQAIKNVETTAGDEQFLGGFINKDKIEIYLKSTYLGNLINKEVDVVTGVVKEYTLPLEFKGEKILGQLNSPNNFLYITASKKSAVFNVYKFAGADKINKVRFDLTVNGINKNLRNGSLWNELSSYSGLSKSADIAIVDPEIECEADIADAPNKLYLRNDSLILLMDKDPESLKLLIFNLGNSEVSIREVKRKCSDQENEYFSKFNSFLLKDRLYSVLASSEGLGITINDFNTGEQIAKFYTAAEDLIHFRNTPITQDGGGTVYSMNASRELSKTKQFLRKVTNGDPVITAVRNSYGQDEITVGAYKKITQTTGGFMPMGGASMSFYPTFGGGASWNRVTRFKALANPSSGQHIEGEMKLSVAEQIQEFSESIKIPEDGSSVFVANNYHQFAYYDKQDKKLVVIKFQ